MLAQRTVNRFLDPPALGGPNVIFEGPGRDNRAFPPPTFRSPSLIALEEEVNGSGAATFESFCSGFVSDFQSGENGGKREWHLFALFADHGLVSADVDGDRWRGRGVGRWGAPVMWKVAGNPEKETFRAFSHSRSHSRFRQSRQVLPERKV